MSESLLAGRNALVVGIDDIGAGIAQAFAAEGARVALVHETSSQAESAARRITAHGGRAHVESFLMDERNSIAAAVTRAAAALGGFSILVTNLLPDAKPAALERCENESFTHAFACVRTVVQFMQCALPHLRENAPGRIINVGSRYGEGINEGIAAYNAAAWSLVGVTRTAAVEWGQHQITSNLLLPFAVTQEFQSAHTKRPALLDMLVDQVPLKRCGDPVRDIGGAALFLASKETGFVNGEIIHADGGQHTAGPVLNPVKFG